MADKQAVLKSLTANGSSSELESPLSRESSYLLDELNHQKHSVQKQLDCGIITYNEAANELDMINRKEQKIKKAMVDEIHVTKDGQPRKITYQEAKGLYYTITGDKKKIYASSLEGLYDKLFDWYNLVIESTSIKSIFEKALDEKARTENNNVSTIQHYNYDFDRFITEEFSDRDIREITKADLKEYTQELVHRMPMKVGAFLQYKGVLNLIFNYASEYDIIPASPVSAIKNQVYLKSCDCSKPKAEEKILSESEIDLLKKTVRQRMGHKTYKGYFIKGYMVLFSIETGMRAAELCALKWDDIKEYYIHIHAQQLSRKLDKGGPDRGSNAPKTKVYYYADWTKDEKGISQGGRKFPLTVAIRDLLAELFKLQKELGIQSEYIFCEADGDWVKTDAYETCLRRLCESLGFKVTNNHALRMSLNSNVLLPLGINEAERSQMLGHSIQTNLQHYSFCGKDNLDDICGLLDARAQVSPGSHLKIVEFAKKESPDSSKIKAFS